MQQNKKLNQQFPLIKVIALRQKQEKLLYYSTMLKTALKCTQNRKILFSEVPQRLFGEVFKKNDRNS